jgi:hypothetical protein
LKKLQNSVLSQTGMATHPTALESHNFLTKSFSNVHDTGKISKLSQNVLKTFCDNIVKYIEQFLLLGRSEIQLKILIKLCEHG